MVTIFHNPNCGTSRNTLALIRNSGIEPEVVLYLETPPSKDQLKNLIIEMGISVREVLRQKGTPYEELDLGNDKWTNKQVICPNCHRKKTFRDGVHSYKRDCGQIPPAADRPLTLLPASRGTGTDQQPTPEGAESTIRPRPPVVSTQQIP